MSRTCSFLCFHCAMSLYTYIYVICIYICKLATCCHLQRLSFPFTLFRGVRVLVRITPEKWERKRLYLATQSLTKKNFLFLFLVLVFLEEKKGKTTLFFFALPPLLRYEQVDTKKKREGLSNTHTHARNGDWCLDRVDHMWTLDTTTLFFSLFSLL